MGSNTFQYLINVPDDGIECTLTKFVNDIRLGGEVNVLEGSATIQGCLDRLKYWGSKNCISFNKDKFEVLHLGLNNPKQT